MNQSVDAYIGLGSNLGDRRRTLDSAMTRLDEVDGIEVFARSTIIETDPIGPVGQGDYLNAVVGIRTIRSPREVLDICLEIEQQHGRDRNQGEKWGSRTLDLDLLLYSDFIIQEPGLTIPHPHLPERAFVLVPLGEIGPSVKHPELNMTIQELKNRLEQSPVGNTFGSGIV